MRIWIECGAFFRAFRRNFYTTGAILPSSRFLARAMASDLKGRRKPARILEVGPGTGAVTREIVRHLQEGDRFDAVEINASFVAHLRKRFNQEPLFRKFDENRRWDYAAFLRCRIGGIQYKSGDVWLDVGQDVPWQFRHP